MTVTLQKPEVLPTGEIVVAGGGPQSARSLVPMEETVRDSVLSARLGYSKPADIRKLIGRHVASLEAMGALRHAGVMVDIGSGARRGVKEYSLNRAQAAFIISKARTPEAANLAIVIAEVFALHTQGKFVAVDDAAAAELQAIRARATARNAALAPGREGWAIVGAFKRSGRRRKLSARYLGKDPFTN